MSLMCVVGHPLLELRSVLLDYIFSWLSQKCAFHIDCYSILIGARKENHEEEIQ